MRFRIAVLGLILLASAFAECVPSSYVSPQMSPLPAYSGKDYNVAWTWANESNICSLVGDACPCDCCFYYYEAREWGAASDSFKGYNKSIKLWERYNRPEGTMYYKVRVVFWSDSTLATPWSGEVSTTVDRTAPYVNAYSEKPVYTAGERVTIWAYATDSSGISYIYLYADGGLVNSSNSGYVTFSGVAGVDFSAGAHAYFANATDKVGLAGTSVTRYFEVTTVTPPSSTPDTIPPNVSIYSNKEKYSNNETVYLHIIANDSGSGINATQVFVNNELKCTNSSTQFTCKAGPYIGVQNGTTSGYAFFANATDNAGNLNTTPLKTFYVTGNSSCSDFGYPVSDGQCASNSLQSFICRCYLAGCALLKKCSDICFCPSGLLCNFSTQACFLSPGTQTCMDGTPYGYCSTTLPMYCSDGALIKKCGECGCPAGQECNSTSQGCYFSTIRKCSDGTPYGQCSVIRPKYCNNGVLIDYCSICGCFDGTQCSLYNSSCFVPPNPEKYIRLGLISPNASSLVLSPGQTARFDVGIRDESGRMVDNATVMLNPNTLSYNSSNRGNGLYEVSYAVDLNATGSFLIGITAVRGENEVDTVTLQVNISRVLDIGFLNPGQDAEVTGSRQVEVEIMYPNGDPVLTGWFLMGIGNRTFALERAEDKYRGFLNFSGENYGTKSISFYGEDAYGNTLDGLLVIEYAERKDYTVYFVALLLIAGGSIMAYFIYIWASNLSRDYKALGKEKTYLGTMDKRTHLEFFKRHIDENTFKKLALEYQQKSADVDRVITEMEKRHRWLRWL